MITLTNRQARQFILLKHGLLGEYKFVGKEGALAYIRQAGCIQYDPIDVCGKNPELVLQSRVKGCTKKMLSELLYKDRALIDYPDKNLSIMPAEDWPYFERYRKASRENAEKFPEMEVILEEARLQIEKKPFVCSDDLKLEGQVFWRSAIHWSAGTNMSRSVLEQMYATGELVIHHKKGARKYYAPAKKHLPIDLLTKKDPLHSDLLHNKWRVLRRIGAVGLMWNKPSDAWLNIWGLKSEEREAIFKKLLDENKISPILIEGQKDIFYHLKEDVDLLQFILQNPSLKPRCECIAPLDNFLWDRRLIQALFTFDYKWEIYTPLEKRKFGYYVLPLLWGERFIGRIEVIANKKEKTLLVKNIWYEENIKITKKQTAAVTSCLKKMARFNQCDIVAYS